MQQNTGKRFTAVVLILIQCILYGIGDPISKAAYETVPVYFLLSLRYTLALGLMLLFWGKRIVRAVTHTPARYWLAPVLCMAGGYIAGNIALKYTEATVVAFIRSLPSILAPILAYLAYRKKYRAFHIPFQLMVLVGLYLLCCTNGIQTFGIGELYALLCAACLAGALVFGERSLDFIDSVSLSALQTAASMLMAFAGLALGGGTFSLTQVSPSVWLVILYLAVLCTIAGYLLQNTALARAPSFVIALVQSLGPIMTAFFSFLILKERLSLKGIAGAAIILTCVIGDTVLDYKLRPG